MASVLCVDVLLKKESTTIVQLAALPTLPQSLAGHLQRALVPVLLHVLLRDVLAANATHPNLHPSPPHTHEGAVRHHFWESLSRNLHWEGSGDTLNAKEVQDAPHTHMVDLAQVVPPPLLLRTQGAAGLVVLNVHVVLVALVLATVLRPLGTQPGLDGLGAHGTYVTRLC